jgi:outer membrane protein OmpA-like peptidoglycan-associated protein
VDFVRLAMALLLTACATMPAPRAAGPCADQTLSIYFADNSAELTAPARAVIADAAHQARQCPVREVEVVGLADYRGPADANLALSRQRAETTAHALEQVGLPAPRFTVSAQGEAGAVAAPGVAVPMRREVQVVIRHGR